MGFLSSLVWVALCCFASDVVGLEPMFAIPTAITCSGITVATTNAQSECNSLPGCTWLADSTTCAVDGCWKFGDDALTATTGLSYTCSCSYSGLSVKQESGSTVNCDAWPNVGYPPHRTGSTVDFYCLRDGSTALDECSYQYLKNGSCVGPYCILTNHTTEAGGKVCKKISACGVYKLSTEPPNGIRLNQNDIASCLTARLAAGDTTACNQNPKYYVSGTSCVEDTSYAPATNQDNPTCTGTAVVKQVKGVVAGAVTTLSYCANANNPVLNTCWNLVNQTVPSSPPGNQCPINPHSNGTLLTENTALCTGDCFIQTISSYYYGYTKICVNAEAAIDEGGSKILVVPSLLALLLLLFFL